ncbi:twin-arginine translocation signal domain-containing protein [Rhodococcus opacus]|nr:twin-arginine translocation signal domain-containing protein [Rhodococcus opacus]
MNGTNSTDNTVDKTSRKVNRRRFIGATAAVGTAAAAIPLLRSHSAPAEPQEAPAENTAASSDADQVLIASMADMMSKSARTPILRRPDDYGMEYNDVFFPSLDGVPLEGWFIPAGTCQPF